jgi:hypothetical protein
MVTLRELLERIAHVRTKERRIILGVGIFRFLVALACAVLGYFLLDWVFDLPYAARLAFAAIGLSVVGYVFYKHLIRELRKIQDDDEIALRIESRNPDLRNRLISTLQLSREAGSGAYVGSPELIAALESETLRMSEPLDFFRIINKELLIRMGVVAVLVLAIKAALVVRYPEYFSALGVRLVRPNAQFPTRTHFKMIKVKGGGFERILAPLKETGMVPRGEELVVEVTAEGDIPQEAGTLLFRSTTRDGAVPIELQPLGGAVFRGALAKALDDMDLIVELGDARSERLPIKVLARPEVDVNASGDCIQYALPAYTKEAPPPPEKFGGLSTLIGSTADVRFVPTKSLAEARLERNDGQSFSFQKRMGQRSVKDKDGNVTQVPEEWWEFPKFPVDKNGSFHLALKDTDGLTNSQPPVEYAIEARPDIQPFIRMVKPTRDLTVTPVAKVNVTFTARDDWGLRTVWLCYRLQTGEAAASGTAPDTNGVKRLERAAPHERNPAPVSFTWDLAALSVKPGDQLVFWLEADDFCDTNDIPPPPRVRPGADEPAAQPAPATPQKSFPRSSDVKLTVISREEKIMELQAELERLYQQIVHAKEGQEELKTKVRIILEELQKLKGGD